MVTSVTCSSFSVLNSVSWVWLWGRTLFLCLSACLGVTPLFGYFPSQLLQEAVVKLDLNTHLRCCLQFLEMEWLGQMAVSFEK